MNTGIQSNVKNAHVYMQANKDLCIYSIFVTYRDILRP